jgi:uncharacterized repeat protein (TIGR03809 family)
LCCVASVFLLAGRSMTHQQDVARGRDILGRWCALAEQRLEYLTELFESGRWRRYHSEASFLENIREAKTAVETWRDLAVREASRDNSPVDISWLGRTRNTLSRSEPLHGPDRPQPQLPEIIASPPLSDVSIPAEAAPDSPDLALCGMASDPAAAKPVLKKRELKPSLAQPPMPTLDIATMQQRYPLLRNAVL